MTSPHQRQRRMVYPGFLCVFLVSASARAETDSESWLRAVNPVASPYAGQVVDIAVDGDRAYVATAGTLAAFDFSDPAAPRFLGFDQTSGTTRALVASGDFAYLVGYHAGLDAHAVDTPAEGLPRAGGYPFVDARNFSGVAVEGDRVFATGYYTDLSIFEFPQPGIPALVASAAIDAGESQFFAANHIRVIGDLIYMAGGDDDWGAVKIYRDVAGGDPVFLGEFRVIDLPSPPTGASRRIEVYGSIAYVADTGLGVYWLDVSDPANPVFLESGLGSPTDIALAGDVLLTVDDGILGVYVLGDPGAPQLVTTLDLMDSGVGEFPRMAVSGEFAYIAGTSGIAAISLADPAHPVVVGGSTISGFRARDVALVGDLAYVAGELGIAVIDIADPADPHHLASAGAGAHYSLVADGRKAVAQWENFGRLYLYDLGADGRTPDFVGEVQASEIRGYDLSGNTLYIARGNTGLQVFSIANPQSPSLVGGWPAVAVGVVVRDALAFVRSRNPGLLILDVRNPSQPVLLGSYQGDILGEVSALAVDGNLAYLTHHAPDTDQTILVVLDVADPGAPQVVGTADLGEFVIVQDIALASGFAFLATDELGDNGMIVDIKDPTQPFFVRRGIGSGHLFGLVGRGDRLYVARGYLGVQILDTSLPLPQLAIGASEPGAPVPVRLTWNAPHGTAFSLEASRDLFQWTPLGRRTAETLDTAVQLLFDEDPALPGYFRVVEP